MPSTYFDYNPLLLFDGDTAFAADVNNLSRAVDAAFESFSVAADAVEILADQVTADAATVAADVITVTGIYDAFDDRYLGTKSEDPELDNDGDSLLEGALYWNSVSKELRAFDGEVWQVTYLPASVYALLTTNTFTGPQTFSDQILSRGIFKDCSISFLDKGNSSTTPQTLDYTDGSHQKITVTGAHTLSTSNWPSSGNLGEMLLELTNGASSTITWDLATTQNWIKSDGSYSTTFAGSGITLQTSGTDWIVLWTRDGGTTVYIKVIR